MKLQIEILPTQAEWLTCDDNITGLIGGFGSGKTNVGAKKFIDRLMTYPSGTHAIANKDLGQYKRGTIVTVQDELRSRGIQFTYNRSDGYLRIRKNGATILPLSAENYETWRALEADTIWADELTTWGPSAEKAFLEFLLPRSRLSPEGVRYRERGHPIKPILFFTTNPPTDTAHWLYDLIVRKQFCRVWHMATYDNYLMQDLEDYVKKIKKAYPPDLWPILLGGQWGNATQGTVYKGFSHKKHLLADREEPLPATLPPFGVDLNQPIDWFLDFNVGLMCSVVGQWKTQRYIITGKDVPAMFEPLVYMNEHRAKAAPGFQEKILYVLGEIRLPDAGTPDVVQAFMQQFGSHAVRRGVRIYGDAAGGARSQTMSAMSSARSNWGIILESLKRFGVPYDFRVQTANPAVMDRINAVKLQLDDIDGVGMLIDEQKAPFLTQDLITVRYKAGTNDIDKENPILTHLSDAVGYGIWIERTLAQNMPVNFLSEKSVM